MKDALRKLCRPVLAFFEKGEPAASYRPSHRMILLAAATLFLILFCVSVYFALSAGQLGAVIPVIVFFVVSVVSLIVATLGSDTAVARIWGLK
ncbi:MAG: hypothetical protein WD071_06355 [Pseudohongiella sp.]|uniref:hypothetical protein n=1 Tax=Pseudohongiella sp. TaxID=1979412 RepID=UPI0034A06DF4